MLEELPEGYYLDNFKFLIGFVEARYSDILLPEEQVFCEQFNHLSADAQMTLVRLLGRRHIFVRQDKCHYKEISDFDAALEELIESDLLRRNSASDPFEWLFLATRPELEAAFPLVLSEVKKSSLKKPELCKLIANALDLEEISQSLEFNLLEPTCREMLDTFRLLFFGNLHQDFTDFVLHELGVVPFEQYPLDEAGRYFQSRSVLEQMQFAYELQAVAEEVMSDPELELKAFAETHLVGCEVSEPTLQRRYNKMFNRVARQLEREEELELALNLYRQSSLPPSRERQSRIHVTLGNVAEGLELCQEIAATPREDAEFEFATSFARRMAKKHGEPLPAGIPAKAKDDFVLNHLTLDQHEELGVEQSVAEYYRQRGAWAEHVENGLLPGLFGLLFWDVIFAPVPGVFFHPFQRGPADIFSDQFLNSRRDLIDEHMAIVQSPERLSTKLRVAFAEKYGRANHFVMWRYLSEEIIDLALERIPVQHLSAVFQRMLKDLKNNRSGFPDLVVFPAEGGYQLVEVKGPGDTLQGNQKRWLRWFDQHDIPAIVTHVTWQN